ncbi:uncharacterized protein BCR38DRAFT_353683 [Pseudomassariella vexata]|uniref:RBR-type E3 ubiquitin transferase n=1 Tax=Pseudomassariella vexata TaxID=1141098 RepID=A0A1Y2DGD7_9PEZI|nr:uncharacterized protein BCR38DRAFT_353683 [Pseudomassariella vexata]ORY58144.1 hypothetical protein BCR38DRAFT_353683 [Pseudomassariella vexata]
MAIEELVAPTWTAADDESLSLILILLREDAEKLKSSSKGKKAKSTLSDAELALQLYIEELTGASTFCYDRRMTKSIRDAIRADAETISQVEEESMADNAHQMSVALSRGESGNENTAQATRNSVADLELIEKLDCLYVTGIENTDYESDKDTTSLDDESDQPESSSAAAARQPRKKSQRRDCQACGETTHFIDLARAPCNHEYCRDCLSHLFCDAMTDESLFPPRCCRQPIPANQNRLFLGADLFHQFQQKSVEFSTPNRTYCHRPNCSAFITPANCIDGVARCADCDAETCTTCKGLAHGGDCPFDLELQRVIEIAREEHWQRCYSCFSMVELNIGCNHMTCRCGAQFCYVCGAEWKTCQCQQWDENRLYTRAVAIDERDNPYAGEEAPDPVVEAARQNPNAGEEAPDPVAEAAGQNPPNEVVPVAGMALWERLARVMESLVQNHECTHEGWRRRGGPAGCEECGNEMPLFIFECRQCHIMACRRCRYHRL